jgi:hypothetical protein
MQSSLFRSFARFRRSANSGPVVWTRTCSCAFCKYARTLVAIDWALSAHTQLPGGVGTRGLTQRGPWALQLPAFAQPLRCGPGAAQSATPSCWSGAAAAGYGSRHRLHLAPARSIASHWASSRLWRGAGSAAGVGGAWSAFAGKPAVMPNPSFKPTRYGRQRKPGLRHLVHHRRPGLRCLPTRAA